MTKFTEKTFDEKSQYVLELAEKGRNRIKTLSDNQEGEFLADFITICANFVFTDSAKRILDSSGEDEMNKYLTKVGKKIRSKSIKRLLAVLAYAIAGLATDSDGKDV